MPGELRPAPRVAHLGRAIRRRLTVSGTGRADAKPESALPVGAIVRVSSPMSCLTAGRRQRDGPGCAGAGSGVRQIVESRSELTHDGVEVDYDDGCSRWLTSGPAGQARPGCSQDRELNCLVCRYVFMMTETSTPPDGGRDAGSAPLSRVRELAGRINRFDTVSHTQGPFIPMPEVSAMREFFPNDAVPRPMEPPPEEPAGEYPYILDMRSPGPR